MVFGRRKKEPVVHPRVARSIFLRDPDARLEALVGEYGGIMGRRARLLELTRSRAGEWLRLELPDDGVHPWEPVNLACWLGPAGPVVLRVEGSELGPGHHLVPVEGHDLLEGHDDDGRPVSVHVPDHRWIRPDDEVSPPARTWSQLRDALGVPTDGWVDDGLLEVPSEDPQHDLHPLADGTAADRAALRPYGLVSHLP